MLGLAELLASLSLATDLATGAPLETALRTCGVAIHLGRRTGVDAATLADAYHAALLRHVGCTAWAHEAARLAAGDDHDVIQTFAGVDRARPVAVAGRALGLGRGRPAVARVRAIAGVLSHPSAGAELVAARCAQAQTWRATSGSARAW